MELEEIELQEPETQQPDPPSKKKVLYDAVSKKYDLGTYDEFELKLKDPTKRKALYDHIGKEFELGTYQDFEAKVSEPLKKKEQTSLPSGNVPLQSVGEDGTKSNEIPIVTDYGNGEIVNPNDPFAMSKAADEFKKTIEIPNED